MLAVAVAVYSLLHGTDLYRIMDREAEGLNTLILLIGDIYAVMFAFVIFVIWGQFTDVENFVARECNSLSDLLRFGGYLNPDANRTIRRAVAEYLHSALKREWDALGERRRDKQTEKCFSELVDAVVTITPASAAEGPIHARLIDIVRRAVRIPMMSISHSDLMPIRTERSDAGLSQCEIVIDIRQEFCVFSLS